MERKCSSCCATSDTLLHISELISKIRVSDWQCLRSTELFLTSSSPVPSSPHFLRNCGKIFIT